MSNKPVYRKLRGYVMDPSLGLSSETAIVSQVVYKVRWEEPPILEEGPTGEYVEVIDIDKQGKLIAQPVNLSEPYILAQDGLAPGEVNFQFHHQMVYAVTMTTIANFEKWLGRPVHWNQEAVKSGEYRPFAGEEKSRREGRTPNMNERGYRKRLKIIPHAFNDPNAYYSPQNNALLFGTFRSVQAKKNQQPSNLIVYTCLSHDVIAHIATHAIIYGLYESFTDGSNPDVLAFHEAFSDIIALFQHLTFPEVLKHEIAKTRGDFTNQNLLFELAHQFGQAIGNHGSLRSTIGEVDPLTKEWKKKQTEQIAYKEVREPHKRGEFLVGAVFEAFMIIYKKRAADFIRIATNGSGILQQGNLHPDLVNRLSEEATSSAKHILKMCIRALDYCPPVDIKFGDFLRAIITADIDLFEEDALGYRIAFIEAFSKKDMFPEALSSPSEDALKYTLQGSQEEINALFEEVKLLLAKYRKEIILSKNREDTYKITQKYIHGNKRKKLTGLYELFTLNNEFKKSTLFGLLTGLVFSERWQDFGVKTTNAFGISGPLFKIDSLYIASRVNAEGRSNNHVAIRITQEATVLVGTAATVDQTTKKQNNKRVAVNEEVRKEKVKLAGGCTLLFDLDSLELTYAISKPLLDMVALRNGKYQIDMSRAKELSNELSNW